MEAIFIRSKDHIIHTVKSKCIFEPKVWSKTFGRKLTQNVVEAKIVHTHLGTTLPLKTFAVTPLSQTVEFAGLHGYNERSTLLVQTLTELESQLEPSRVTRIDVCIDYANGIPKSIVRSLSKNREPFQWHSTTYYKTHKELENKDRSNAYMDIKIYNKAHQAKLDHPLWRLEFVFKSKYLKGLSLRDLNLAIKKMEKTIKSVADITVKINPIIDLKR